MNVNDNAKETIDTIDYIVQWGGGIWNAAPIELKAFILSVFTISILMQWVKKTFLEKKTKRERISLLWSSSLPLGIIIASTGYFISDGKIHLGYWIVIGLTSGSTAMGVHFVTIKIIFPAAMTIGKAVWERILLVVRGAPKNE